MQLTHTYCRSARTGLLIALSHLVTVGSAVTASHSDRQPWARSPIAPPLDNRNVQGSPSVPQSDIQAGRNRPSMMRRQDVSSPPVAQPSVYPSSAPAGYQSDDQPHYIPVPVPVPMPCPPGEEGATDPHSPNYNCESYMEGTGCGWTVEYNCPDQHPGQIGAAAEYFYDTADFSCCCMQNLWRVTESVAELKGMVDSSPIAGILQGSSRPKLILAQDVDWPPYAYIGQPPESDYDVAGIGHDIAIGMGDLCNIDIEIVQTPWANCWDGSGKPWPKIGQGLEEGWYHGCMTYTHPQGMRGRFLEWSYAILQKNKPAGLIALLNADGTPKVDPHSSLSGLKIVDVAGWAPLSDGIAFVTNKCTQQEFANYTVSSPKDETGTAIMGNDAAMKVLRAGEADVMFIYADQAHNYECTADGKTHSGATPTWNCTLWEGFGTQYAYIQMGLFGYMINGTTLTMSRKGSGLPELINPCLQEFMGTADYYDICEKHHLTEFCFKNKHFPDTNVQKDLWMVPTNEQPAGCNSGYCGCIEPTTTTVTTATTASTATTTTATTTTTTLPPLG